MDQKDQELETWTAQIILLRAGETRGSMAIRRRVLRQKKRTLRRSARSRR